MHDLLFLKLKYFLMEFLTKVSFVRKDILTHLREFAFLSVSVNFKQGEIARFFVSRNENKLK